MNVKPFIDTNILIYAYDLDAGGKHLRALESIHGTPRRTIN
jgi:predicted nucleic acid-binding protein